MISETKQNLNFLHNFSLWFEPRCLCVTCTLLNSCVSTENEDKCDSNDSFWELETVTELPVGWRAFSRDGVNLCRVVQHLTNSKQWTHYQKGSHISYNTRMTVEKGRTRCEYIWSQDILAVALFVEYMFHYNWVWYLLMIWWWFLCQWYQAAHLCKVSAILLLCVYRCKQHYHNTSPEVQLLFMFSWGSVLDWSVDTQLTITVLWGNAGLKVNLSSLLVSQLIGFHLTYNIFQHLFCFLLIGGGV